MPSTSARRDHDRASCATPAPEEAPGDGVGGCELRERPRRPLARGRAPRATRTPRSRSKSDVWRSTLHAAGRQQAFERGDEAVRLARLPGPAGAREHVAEKDRVLGQRQARDHAVRLLRCRVEGAASRRDTREARLGMDVARNEAKRAPQGTLRLVQAIRCDEEASRSE